MLPFWFMTVVARPNYLNGLRSLQAVIDFAKGARKKGCRAARMPLMGRCPHFALSTPKRYRLY